MAIGIRPPERKLIAFEAKGRAWPRQATYATGRKFSGGVGLLRSYNINVSVQDTQRRG
jgi:hypothetical protein